MPCPRVSAPYCRTMLKRFVIAALLLFPLVVHTNVAWAQASAPQLPGGVYVMAEVSGNGTVTAFRSSVLEAVETDLRKAGIQVLTEEEWIQTEGSPVLYAEIELKQGRNHEARIDTRLSLQQFISEGKEAGTYRTLWSRAAKAEIQSIDPTALTRSISGLTAHFLMAYASQMSDPAK